MLHWRAINVYSMGPLDVSKKRGWVRQINGNPGERKIYNIVADNLFF